MNVLVIYGGVSEEREVSVRSGQCVCAALQEKRITTDPVLIDTALPDARLLSRARAADAVFLCLHGGTGENGAWQAALEKAGIFHYTGSPPTASALAMEKPLAKARVKEFGIPVATGSVWKAGDTPPGLPFPFVAKPCNGGSSVGFSIVNSEKELAALSSSTEWLCESYLPGKEYSVAILDGRALPPIEIRPQGGLYDYTHKYSPGATLELCPAPIAPSQLAQLQNLALICFSALELRDFARIDFKEDARGTPCFLEANSIPGMTQTSLFPLAARTAGLPMPELCEKMARCAAARKG